MFAVQLSIVEEGPLHAQEQLPAPPVINRSSRVASLSFKIWFNFNLLNFFIVIVIKKILIMLFV
jgi:hypothetical protein